VNDTTNEGEIKKRKQGNHTTKEKMSAESFICDSESVCWKGKRVTTNTSNLHTRGEKRGTSNEGRNRRNGLENVSNRKTRAEEIHRQ